LLAALAQDPHHQDARLLLADRQRAAGRSASANALLADGLALEPEAPRLRAAYGRMLVDDGRLEQAREVCLAGSQPRVTEDPDHYLLLAAVYQRLGLYAPAVEAYRAVLGLRPESGRCWLGLAIALESDGKAEEAAAAYRQALVGERLEGSSRDFAADRLTALQAATIKTKGGQGQQ
jgi:MSHA biogenesis protein MshN